MRFAYSGVLLGAVLVGVEGRFQGPLLYWSLGLLGRELFELLSTMQLWAVWVLTPLLVASGLQEEREAQTLDLLALTGVPSWQILVDIVSSRLWLLVAALAAGLPAMALLNSLGGFSAAEVINAQYGAMAMATLLASFSAFAGLVIRGGPVVPALLCVPYALIAFGGTQAVLALPEAGWAGFIPSPFRAAFSGDPLAPLGGLLWIPALATGWQLTVSVFRILASGDEREGGLESRSTHFWEAERYLATTVLWVSAAVFAVMVTFLLSDLPIASGLAVAAAALFAVAWQRVAMSSVWWIGLRMAAGHHLSWRRAPRKTRTVSSPIVAWREVFTRAGGPARVVPALVLAGWLVHVVFERHELDERAAAQLTAEAALGACLVASTLAVAALLEDRRRGTLPLLFLSRVRPWHVAVQKLVGPLLIALPILVVANGWYAVWLQDPGVCEYPPWHYFGPNVLPGARVVPWLAGIGGDLLLAANCALFAAAAASMPRQAAVAWPAGLLAAFLWVFGLLVVAILAEQVVGRDAAMRWLDDLGHVWYARTADHHARACALGGVPLSLVASIGLQAAALPVAMAAFTVRLRVLGRAVSGHS